MEIKKNVNNNVIFVGNDSNKDQETLLYISNALPEINFKFISNLPLLKDIKNNNVELIKGDWSKVI